LTILYLKVFITILTFIIYYIAKLTCIAHQNIKETLCQTIHAVLAINQTNCIKYY